MTPTTGKLFTVTLFGITEGMHQNFGPRALKRKKWDIVSRDHSNITVLDVGMTREGGTSHPPAAKGNFLYELWDALKPQVVQNYNTHKLC
jgi:hypothetical protein